MQQPSNPQELKVFLGQGEAPAEGHRQDADVHRVESGVFVAGPEPRKADQGIPVSHHAVHDVFHRFFCSLGIDRPAQTDILQDGVHHFFGLPLDLPGRLQLILPGNRVQVPAGGAGLGLITQGPDRLFKDRGGGEA